MRRSLVPTRLVGPLVVIALLAFGADRAQAVTVTITGPPGTGTIVSSPQTVSATVTSTLDVAMVRAHMGTVDVAMTPIPALPGQWSAAMDLTSLPYGNVTLTITATDIAGASASASRDYLHDEPPRITVTSPEVNTVARPMLHVVATCTDDAPGNACNQFGAGVQIGSTQGVGGAIDHTFDLTSIDGSAVTLVVTARDSVGHQARVDVPVFVEASPDLTEIISVGRRVLDIDATRVLYSDSGGRVHVRQRTGGADAVVGMIADVGFRPAEGHLTSTGAVWVSMPGAPSTRSAQLIAWRGNGAAAQVGTMEVTNAPYIDEWTLAGDWAFRRASPVERVNVATGATSTVTCPVSPVPLPTLMPVGARNGDVFCPVAGQNGIVLVRDRGGVQTDFAVIPASASGVLVDGPVVAYVNGTGVAMVREGGAEVTLGDLPAMQYPWRQYDVAGAWVTYSKRSMTSQALQIWARAPDGTQRNLTPFAADSVVDGMFGDGTTVVVTGNAIRYVALGAPLPAHVGSALGSPRFRADGLYVVLGRTALKYGGSFTPSVDAGVPADAAGPIDAATDLDAAADIDAATDTDGGNNALGDGGGCCSTGSRSPTGPLVAALLAFAASLSLRRRRAR